MPNRARDRINRALCTYERQAQTDVHSLDKVTQARDLVVGVDHLERLRDRFVVMSVRLRVDAIAMYDRDRLDLGPQSPIFPRYKRSVFIANGQSKINLYAVPPKQLVGLPCQRVVPINAADTIVHLRVAIETDGDEALDTGLSKALGVLESLAGQKAVGRECDQSQIWTVSRRSGDYCGKLGMQRNLASRKRKPHDVTSRNTKKVFDLV
jgi:hypothetical protein